MVGCAGRASVDPVVEAQKAESRGDLTRAAELYEQAAQGSRSPQLFLRYAAVAQQRGDFKKAEELYRSVLRNIPQSGEALRGLGLLLYRQGQYTESQTLLTRAWRQHPRDPRLQYDVGLSELAVGNYRVAAERFRGAIRDGLHNGDVYSNLGYCYLKLRQVGKAEKVWKDARRKGLVSASLLTNIALLDYENGKIEDARRHLDLALKQPNPPAETYNARALVALANGDLSQAIAFWTKASRTLALLRGQASSHTDEGLGFSGAIRPSPPRARIATILGARGPDMSKLAEQAEAALSRGDLAAAEKSLERLRSAQPDDQDIQSVLAYVLLEQGKLEQGGRILQDLQKQKQLSANALYNMALLLARQGSFDKAVATLEAGIKDFPKDPYLHELLGYALEEKGEMQSAERQYSRALSLQASLVLSRNNRGAMYLASGMTKKASDDFRLISESSPIARFNFGLSLLELHEYAQAKQQFLRVINISPNDSEALVNLGFIYARDGDYQQAKGYFDKALSVDPKSSLALNNLGVIASQQNKTAEAKSYLEKALQIDSGNSAALKNLAAISLREKDLAKARELFLRSVELSPADLSARRDLGHLALLLREPKLAQENLQVALGLDPKNPDIVFNLGVAYQMSGDSKESVRFYKKYLEMVGKNMSHAENALQAERAIQSLTYPQ